MHIDRHITLWGLFGAAAFSVAMMAAPLYLNDLPHSMLGRLFWGGLALFVVSMAITIILAIVGRQQSGARGRAMPITLMVLGALVFFAGAIWLGIVNEKPSGRDVSNPVPAEQKRLFRITVLRVSAALSEFVANNQRNQPSSISNNPADISAEIAKFEMWAQNALADYQQRFGQDMAYIANTAFQLKLIDNHMALLMNHPTNPLGMQMVSSKLSQIAMSLTAE
jgi:MFS family permease